MKKRPLPAYCGSKASPRRPCSFPFDTSADTSRNGVDSRDPSFTMRMRPPFSTMKSRASPEGVVRSKGLERPLATGRSASVISADGGGLGGGFDGGSGGGFDGGSGLGSGSGVGSPPPPDEQAARSAMVVRRVRIRGIDGSNRKNTDISTIYD